MATTYLSRSGTGASSITEATISAWVKRASTGSNHTIFHSSYQDATTYLFKAFINSSDQLEIENKDGSTNLLYKTNRLFRDLSAFYNIVIKLSLTASGNDRCKVFINGVEETSFATQTAMTGDQFLVGKNNYTVKIGNMNSGSSNYWNGSMAHVHAIDGTAYDADTFGETDATTGIWKPKTAPSVTYGTNGFFLKFENSAAFGTDSSGEGNTFTTNGTMTQIIDTPSNVFATGNPLLSNLGTWSNGNNTIVGSSSTDVRPQMWSTLGVTTGKYYCECKYTDKTGATSGVADYTAMSSIIRSGTYNGAVSGSSSYQPDGSVYNNGGGTTPYGSALSNNDILSMALDLDNDKLYYGVNGVWQNSGVPTSGATGTGAVSLTNTNGDYWFFSNGDGFGGSSATAQVNYGNGFFGTTAVSSAQNPDDGIGIFEYDVPTGYRALCTKSINAQEYS